MNYSSLNSCWNPIRVQCPWNLLVAIISNQKADSDNQIHQEPRRTLTHNTNTSKEKSKTENSMLCVSAPSKRISSSSLRNYLHGHGFPLHSGSMAAAISSNNRQSMSRTINQVGLAFAKLTKPGRCPADAYRI